ncbi:hypothetical protein [Specibacter sp. RAF43]|uniref:hypothetical protein n=1 Tax=Specibacter sp. RAF43 TaxID=3233057 RepID=UPI003F9CA870
MTTPDEQPQERPTPGPRPGHYGEISPGVPRYGQYAPQGWAPPSHDAQAPGAKGTSDAGTSDAGTSFGLPPAAAYPGFQGGARPGPVPPGTPLIAPRQVVRATRLIALAGLIQAGSGLLLLAVLFLPAGRSIMVDAMKSAMPKDPAYDSLFADPGLVTTLLVLAMLVSLVGAAAYFWLAAKIRRGRNWARTTAAVLAGVSLLGLVQPNFLAMLQVGLGVIAMIILFRSPAKEYFATPHPGGGPRGY